MENKLNSLIRYSEPEKTVGILSIGDCIFNTLELPWKDNKRNISCIPDGFYVYKVDHSNNKHRLVIELKNVRGRSDIQIHVATKLSQLQGCIGLPSKSDEETVFKLLGVAGVLRIETINKNITINKGQ